jgi:hypothetical protein
MAALGEQADRLERAAADMLALREQVEGVEWPMAAQYGTEPEASWGPPEVLAHVQEYLRYWLGEIERVIAAPGPDAVPFGRIADDPVRIGVIGRDRTVPLTELFARIESDARRVAARLRLLTEEEAGRRGLHPTRGEMTVRDQLEPFLVGHTEGHVLQLRDALAVRQEWDSPPAR